MHCALPGIYWKIFEYAWRIWLLAPMGHSRSLKACDCEILWSVPCEKMKQFLIWDHSLRKPWLADEKKEMQAKPNHRVNMKHIFTKSPLLWMSDGAQGSRCGFETSAKPLCTHTLPSFQPVRNKGSLWFDWNQTCALANVLFYCSIKAPTSQIKGAQCICDSSSLHWQKTTADGERSEMAKPWQGYI